MSRKQLRHSTGQDAGMALPMVIILIIGLSLWMASVAILTRSTGATITQNIAQMQDRQRLAHTTGSRPLSSDRTTVLSPPAPVTGIAVSHNPGPPSRVSASSALARSASTGSSTARGVPLEPLVVRITDGPIGSSVPTAVTAVS